jgi:hypothetical protein
LELDLQAAEARSAHSADCCHGEQRYLERAGNTGNDGASEDRRIRKCASWRGWWRAGRSRRGLRRKDHGD